MTVLALTYAAAGLIVLVAAWAATIDPSWAPVANTALIIVLAIVNAGVARKANRASRAARDAKRAAGADRRNHEIGDTGERRRITDKDCDE